MLTRRPVPLRSALVGARPMRWIPAVLAVASWLILGAPVSHAQDGPGSPAAVANPVEVSTSFLVSDISGLNLANGTFNASFYVAMRCPDPCNRMDWDVLNATTIAKEVISERVDETWWLVSGTFTFNPDLRLFPFDSQALPIEIEHRQFDAGALVFVPDSDASEVSSDVTIPGWDIEPLDVTATTTAYKSLGASYSRITFAVPLSRSTVASITKYYLPLTIFVLLSIATLLLSRFEVQISTAGAGLVGLTVFYLATGTGTGSVGYLTLWDVSVLLGYLVLGLVLVCGVLGVRRTDRGLFEGDAGLAASRRLRRHFFTIIVTILAVGSITIVLTDALT